MSQSVDDCWRYIREGGSIEQGKRAARRHGFSAAPKVWQEAANRHDNKHCRDCEKGCPQCGRSLYYAPATGEHACSDRDCAWKS